jgi:hypothetical protein
VRSRSEAITEYRRVGHLNKDSIVGRDSEINVTTWIFSVRKWKLNLFKLTKGQNIN